ncbi:MAG: hypothetical protein IT193_02035 [Propionibacteriaceae bacterium]|nr:hypothetical protein [Propionibacteriaceae bacterium]
MDRQQPTPWWVPILLGFLGLTAGFLTVAYLSWIQVAGQVYWFGLFMAIANLAATVAAIVATGMDARSGQVAWTWWAVLGSFVVVSMALFGFMGLWAPR